jgi:hypothetical protein
MLSRYRFFYKEPQKFKKDKIICVVRAVTQLT